ncbi:hypothetical protein XM38_027870 [Halomicronema hongdechloris C2206]|uniref:ChrR-like cupin domain-containing protein n=1 Tax=Halomicronema hongdechloris C2206 TaxID=1641165 RepID=A0A1Z3HNE6_9CYAN|nr:cupin domain-containing protein [Halomicronema hongdechloris]ASC71833.1 hypothetical protein XM38_027870 [Halomicronema hongdechloris C2206]
MNMRSQISTSASSANAWPGINPLVIPELGTLCDRSDTLPWQPFRPGVDICRLYGDGSGPAAALLRYHPGAHVPHHYHSGYEHILVLSGSQRDRHQTYAAGTLVINPPGSDHAVTSDDGCLVLVIWEKSVVIRDDAKHHDIFNSATTD